MSTDWKAPQESADPPGGATAFADPNALAERYVSREESSVGFRVRCGRRGFSRSRRLCATAVLAACTLAACGSEVEKAISASKDLAERLARADRTPAPTIAQSVSSGAPVRLYMDASRSMGGFVGCGAASTFDATLDHLASDLGVDSLTLFGEAKGSALFEERPIDRSVHCGTSFTRTRNPDYELYRAIATYAHPAVHIYLTDGVQSAASSATPSPSVAALQRWIQGGHGLAILAFRSRFSGPLWSEGAQRFIGDATTEQRPFYAFILAPSDAAVDGVLARLSPALVASAIELRFSSAAIACRVTRRVSPFTTETTDPVWVLAPLAGRRDTAPSGRPVAQMSCPISANSPLAEVGASTSVEYRPWTGQDFARPAPIPAGTRIWTDSLRGDQNGSTTTVMALFPPNAATRFGFYQVRLIPRPGRLKPVVEQLSTDDDNAPTQAAKTYRFNWLVEHLVRSRFSAIVPECSFFLTIQNQ